MNKFLADILKTILITGVIALAACSENTPPTSVPKVVKQKIVVPSAPATQTGEKESKEQAAAVPETVAQTAREAAVSAEPNQAAKAPVQEESGSEPATAEKPAEVVDETAGIAAAQPGTAAGDSVIPDSDMTRVDVDQAEVPRQSGKVYNPQGRINPFAPLFKDQGPPELADTSKGKRLKRHPQTPLEKVALSQLKLTAIIRSSSINRGLVSDATGKGYVVQPGTYIGLNSGKVVQIERDRIVIEEEYEDLNGEFKIHNSELKLQKPAGEF